MIYMNGGKLSLSLFTIRTQLRALTAQNTTNSKDRKKYMH